MRIVIIVEFRVISDEHEAFLRLILDNAAASLKREPGCIRFDVLVPEGQARGSFMLYEIYADATAFEDHLRSEHYRLFDERVSPLVVEKKVARFGILEPEVGGAP
jgi:(4S)-4-hydroxy-5-phosphonooxypentane-2,3-dione isomerase